jgi:hypothetical protein
MGFGKGACSREFVVLRGEQQRRYGGVHQYLLLLQVSFHVASCYK